MEIYTIVHTAEDNGMVLCYGEFSSRKSALQQCEKMNQEIDRDIAGGGDEVIVCKLQSLYEWNKN
jgi:hypothetical protein